MQSQMAAPVAMSDLDVHQKIAEWCSVPIWMGVTAMTHAISAAEGTYRTNSVVTTPVQKALGPFLPNRTTAKTGVMPRTTSEVADPMEMQSPCPPDVVYLPPKEVTAESTKFTTTATTVQPTQRPHSR